MTYSVVLHDKAEQFLIDSCQWWAENRSVEQAGRWRNEFLAALESLAEHPSRCPLASDCNNFPFEVRELRFGLGRKPTHRALFTIRPDMVYVFLIRHLTQRAVTPDDV